MYIGWATNVNKDILDSTPITVGEGATVKDNLEAGGPPKERVTNSNPPDKYKVTMNFDCVTKGSDGLTELERFWVWYKYRHCYGTNPFLFPAILINSNRQSGYSQEDIEYITQRIVHGDPTAKLPDNEYYKISSAVEGSKSGNDLQVSMTWETYATGSYTIPDETSTIQRIEAHNGYLDVILTSTPQTEPNAATWTVYVKKDSDAETVQQIANSFFDGDVTTRLFFPVKTTAGTYTMRIGEFTSFFTVS